MVLTTFLPTYHWYFTVEGDPGETSVEIFFLLSAA